MRYGEITDDRIKAEIMGAHMLLFEEQKQEERETFFSIDHLAQRVYERLYATSSQTPKERRKLLSDYKKRLTLTYDILFNSLLVEKKLDGEKIWVRIKPETYDLVGGFFEEGRLSDDVQEERTETPLRINAVESPATQVLANIIRRSRQELNRRGLDVRINLLDERDFYGRLKYGK